MGVRKDTLPADSRARKPRQPREGPGRRSVPLKGGLRPPRKATASGGGLRKHSAKISFARLQGESPCPHMPPAGGRLSSYEEVTMAKKYEICLRLSKEERELLERSARACGLTKSLFKIF